MHALVLKQGCKSAIGVIRVHKNKWLEMYMVTRSYSSCLFLCALDVNMEALAAVLSRMIECCMEYFC